MKYTDQMGQVLELKETPKRIVSLVPSQTEFLCDLGLQDQIVGCTKFCIHPASIKKTAKIIGGTKTLNLSIIESLKPDIVIGNKEENEQSQIIALSKTHAVWMSDIANLNQAIEMMSKLAEIFQKEKEAETITSEINTQFANINTLEKSKKVLYLIWKDPYMLAGKQTFIDDIIHHIGLENAVQFLPNPNRYPEINESQIIAIQPDLLFLSSEPYPFKEKHLAFFQEILPNTKVQVVDGELFSWYGSRLLKSSTYFNRLLS
jgi:ABC-type Fe3+-hydroxamate transport system substrate-binding protein